MHGAFFSFFTQKLLLLFVIIFTSNSYASLAEKQPYTNKYEEIKEIISENYFPVQHSIKPKKIINSPLISYANNNEINDEMISEKHNQFIKITNSTLDKFYVESSIFEKLVSINENYIKSNLDINMSNFIGPLDIKYTRIANALLMYQSIFQNRLTLSFSKVHGETQLSSNTFNNDVDFFNIFFNDNVLLYQCLFKGSANFAHSTFNDNTYFNYNVFKKSANFNSVSFNKNVSFKNSVFLGDTTFENTLLPLHVDFSDVRIRGNKINLENTKPVLPGKKIHINIKNTDINKIDFNYNDFRLFFPKDTNLEDKLFIYSGLLKKYQRLGMNNSYKVLFREYREFKLLSENKYITNFVEKNWWNYGLNKEWVYSWFAIIISILTLLNGFFYDIFVSKYFNINFLKIPKPNAACQLNPILNYIYNLPRAAILTFFFVFATFLQVLANEDRIFKTDHFLVNTYVMLINCLGYIFIIFVLDIVTG